MKVYHFVLVAGASHGGWCYYKIKTLLESAGHGVTCIDLKSQGIELTDANTVVEFDDFNQPLISFFSSQVAGDEKVILVGHSAGGLNITDILHRFPEKIHAAVYIAAIMYRNGSKTTGCPQNHLTVDKRCLEYYSRDFGPAKIHTSVIIKPECRRKLLYGLSPIEDMTLASLLLRPHPVLPEASAHFDENPKVDSIRRIYIRTTKDGMMSQEEHDNMIKQWPPSKVVALDSDHSPFFSTPDELFKTLVEFAASEE